METQEKGSIKREPSPFTAHGSPTQDFLDICEQLDVSDQHEFVEKAWKQYDIIGQQCVLEGGEKAWMACSLYVTSWQSAPFGQEPIYKFSLSKLLQLTNTSVLEFFEKLTKWVEMINGSRRLADHVNRIQSSLAVSTVVYKKYLPIFRRVFASPNSSKQSVPLNAAQIFEFVWIIFVTFKKQFAGVGDDLMNCFHLLLCVVDLIYADIRDANLSALFNQEFVQELERRNESVLENLCSTFEGVSLDAKHFRAHWFIPKLRSMIDQQIILANADLTCIVDNLEINRRNLNKFYEEAMVKKCEIDERMFITPNIDMVFNEACDMSAITMLRRSNLDSSWAVDAELLLRMSTQACLEKINGQRNQQTPLSAKSYVISGEQFCPITPIGAATHKAQKMLELLRVDYRHIDTDFDRLLTHCRDNPKLFINDRVRHFGERLENKVEEEKTSRGAQFDEGFTTMIKQRRENVEVLFHRFLQRVVLSDQEKNAHFDSAYISAILHKEEFIASLWACALELILFTHNSERAFPWSVGVIGMAPINFYKIIELVIRSEPELSRDMVKHLNRVEERVLEELAWSVDSPLWGALAQRANGVPSCQSVTPITVEQGGNQQNRNAPPTNLATRFTNTPVKTAIGGPVPPSKRRIDYTDEMAGMPQAKRHATDAAENQGLPSSTTIFFRKVYYLAAVRLNDLCDRIRMDERGRQKVWTLFEHMLRTETALMAGRHLDQNLMCCLYIISKITNLSVAFHEIMYHYRHQPQASSRVYRQVLLDPAVSPATVGLSDDGASRDSISSMPGGKLRSGSTLPAPDMTSAPPTPEPHNLDYTDLIKYYNRVFICRVEEFVKKLQPTAGTDSKENTVLLQSMPSVKCNTLSPRRTVADQISVVPLSPFPPSPSRPMRYNFNRSPSKDLKAINTIVRGGPGGSSYATPRVAV